MPRVALLSTSDTDLLSARSSRADYVLANPSRLDVTNELPALLAGRRSGDRPDPRDRAVVAGRAGRNARSACRCWCWVN